MKVNLRHVQQRKQAYFFRMAIPEGLRHFYDGRKEISQSLRTDNPIELQQIAQQLAGGGLSIAGGLGVGAYTGVKAIADRRKPKLVVNEPLLLEGGAHESG